MAKVHYLNWDNAGRDADPTEFFHNLSISEGEDISTIPKDWYRAVAEVPDIEEEKVWKAFQGGVPVDRTDEDMVAAKRAHEQAKVRSMSVGDVIEFSDGRMRLAISFGFTDVDWGDAPDLESLLPERE